MELQLSPITPSAEYCKEWNVSNKDFVALSKGGELISNSLYRIGGLGTPNLNTDNYFMLLKYVEAIYDYDFIKRCYPNKSRLEIELERKHLEARWCIIDKNGIEKKEFDQFKNPYLKKDSCIYSIDGNYYNIESGEFYCSTSKFMESSECLFLENNYDKDASKIGVMKINKKDGTWELFQ